MTEKKLILSSTSDLQRIGLRAQVAAFLIAEGVEAANVVNDVRDICKVIVALRAEDPRINEIRAQLVMHLNRLKETDAECYSRFPSDISAGEPESLDNPHPILLLSPTGLSSSLMLEQTSKGVGAMLSLTDVLKPLARLPTAIEALTSKLEAK